MSLYVEGTPEHTAYAFAVVMNTARFLRVERCWCERPTPTSIVFFVDTFPKEFGEIMNTLLPFDWTIEVIDLVPEISCHGEFV